MKIKILFILTIIFSQTCLGNESLVQVGRYLTLSKKPTFSQVELLSQTIQVRFPQNIQTIRDAMIYLLRFSGYAMVPVDRMSKEFRLTLDKPLPLVDRELGPISLRNGLTVLAGPAFVLVEYPISREINFQLKPYFQKKIYRSDKGKEYI